MQRWAGMSKNHENKVAKVEHLQTYAQLHSFNLYAHIICLCRFCFCHLANVFMGFLFGITIPTSLHISRIYYLFVHFFHALAPCYLSGSGPMLISVFVATRSQDSLLYNYDWGEPDRAPHQRDCIARCMCMSAPYAHIQI